MALQLYTAFQQNLIQTSFENEQLIKFKIYTKSGIPTLEEVTNKLPKLKRSIPGVETQMICTSSAFGQESDRNWVSFLEKAIVKRLCSGIYNNLNPISMIEVFRCLVGPVPI